MNGITTSTECFGAEYYTNKVYDMFMRLDDSGKLFEPEQTFTRTGIAANVNEWLYAKRHLFDLFRKHPNWNEEAKAIVFLNSEHREPDAQTVKKIGQRIINNGFMTSAHYGQLTDILRDITSMNPLNVLDEWTANRINSAYPSVKAVKGQKTSRIINKLFTMLEADKLLYNYNSLFAQLADACNPLTVERITVFSLNIIDFLLMSHGNSWRSCHTILDDGGNCSYGGCYKGGTLSYANDVTTICMYTVDKNYRGTDWCFEPKIVRQIFFWDYPVLVQERLYPQENDYSESGKALCDQYRHLAEDVLAVCCGVPNLWTVESKNTAQIYAVDDTFMYHDWESFPKKIVHLQKNAIKVLDSRSEHGSTSGLSNYVIGSAKDILVGGSSYCIQCGEKKYADTYDDEEDGESTLLCADCFDAFYHKHRCASCGSYCDEGDTVIYNDTYYCTDCCTYCEYHEEYEPNDIYDFEYVKNYGNVCVEALRNDDEFFCCDDCGLYYYGCENMYITDDDKTICTACYEYNYATCEICGEIYNNTDLDYIDGVLCCESCAEQIQESETA